MVPFLDFLTPLVEKALSFIPDPKMKAEAQLKMTEELNRNQEAILTALSAVDQKQAEINTEEAKSSNLFVSGARPFILWVCGLAFTWAFVGQPFIVFILTASGHPIKDLPQINMSEMMPVLLGILGLGGLRTYEKSQAIENRHG